MLAPYFALGTPRRAHRRVTHRASQPKITNAYDIRLTAQLLMEQPELGRSRTWLIWVPVEHERDAGKCRGA
jgi:hypothetical protein